MSERTTREDILRYYEDCDVDYRMIWGIDRNLGLHYGFYDEHHTDHHSAVLNQNRVMAERAGIKPGDRVLDCGCGIGGSCIWLAENVGAKAEGINISEYQIRRGRELVRERGLQGRVELHVGDFADTGFPDESFDVVWGMEAMSYAPDKPKLVREIHRLLKPGGRLVCSDGWMNDIAPKPELDAVVREWLDCWAVPQLAGVEEFKGYLNEVGFADIKFWDAYDYAIRSSHRMYKYSLLAYPVAKVMRWVRLRSQAQWNNVRAAYLQYKGLAGRAWIHGHFVATK